MKALSALKVLVVDDQPIIDEFCRKVLEHLGCEQVYSALSGREAIEILTREPRIDMVLTDIDMQPGNGLELLQTIRCGGIPKVPRDLCVLMFTDYNYRNNVMNAVGLDCNGFVSKPLSVALLSDKIDAARRRKITLADTAVYRSIPTGVNTAVGVNKPANGSLYPRQSADSTHTPVHEPSTPEPTVSSTPNPGPSQTQAPPEENDADRFRQALTELVPSNSKDPFLQQKQQQLTDILHQLDAIRREISFGSDDTAAQMTNNLEQISAEMFGQEYQHQREHHFSHLSAHQAEHGMILQRTQMLANKIRQNKKPKALLAHQQLMQAWYHHIAGKDQRYARYLTTQGTRG
jgi:CheY-like chemotaxis protein